MQLILLFLFQFYFYVIQLIIISISIHKKWIDSKFKFCDVLSQNLMRCVNTFEFLTFTKRTSSFTNLLRYEKICSNVSESGLKHTAEIRCGHVAKWDSDMLWFVESDMLQIANSNVQILIQRRPNSISQHIWIPFLHVRILIRHVQIPFRNMSEFHFATCPNRIAACRNPMSDMSKMDRKRA